MTLRLAHQLTCHAERVDLVSLDGRGELQGHVPPRVRLFDLQGSRAYRSLKPFLWYLVRERPQALIAALPSANLFACLARFLRLVPTVLITERNAHSPALIPRSRESSRRVTYLLSSLAYGQADALVGVSQGVQESLNERFPRLRRRTYAVPNPAFPDEDPESVGWPPHPWLSHNGIPCVVTVGRLVPQKDHNTLLRAINVARERREVRLLIVGEGTHRGATVRQIEELGLAGAVKLVGYRSDRLAFIRWADVFALSSLNEGFGNVLVEALAMGTPVVSTDCPSGPREILDDGKFGALTRCSDPVALADAILQSLERPHDVDALRLRAREYSLDRITLDYLDILRRVRKVPRGGGKPDQNPQRSDT